MSRKTIGSEWDRGTRNDINDNFEELYDDVDDVAGKITDDVYDEIKDSVKIHWKEPVETEDDLPSDADEGDTRMVLESEGDSDDDELNYFVYRFDGDDWVKIQGFKDSTIADLQEKLESELDDKADKDEVEDKIEEALDDAKDYTDDMVEADKNVRVEESGDGYIRYSDGLQICWTDDIKLKTDKSWGKIYRSDVEEWEYPKSFTKAPFSFSIVSGAYGRFSDVGSPVKKDKLGVIQYSAIESDSKYSIRATVMGFWK